MSEGQNVLIPPLPLLNFFVAVVMFSIGLRVTGSQLLGILQNRALFVRTLVANCIVIPALGFLLVHIFPLTPDASVGILLLAAIPGTPIALQFNRKATSRLAFAATMTFALSLVSLAIAPLMIEVMPQIVERNQRPILQLFTDIALYIGLPLFAGRWAARLTPQLAPRIVAPLNVLATVAFLTLMFETRLVRKEAFNAIKGGGAVWAMALLLLSSMAVGWFVGGPDPDSRRVVATTTGMRSVIVVLYVARSCFTGTNVFMVPIAYLTLMIPTNLVFTSVYSMWRKRHPAIVGVETA
jgi:BASS family bile acid:Na+ symporter